MSKSNVIEHYGHNGRILRFENKEGLYQINRYQSLLMATNAYTEALAYVGQMGRSLEDMRAAEICCGGGPAAIVLKDAGVGYVEATDINSEALEMCRKNASLNGLKLDRVVTNDMLGPPRKMEERFDLIVCNPPCGRINKDSEITHSELTHSKIKNKHLKTAVEGGTEGIRLVLPLITTVKDHLLPGGLLIFVLTSTMNFSAVVKALEENFKGTWRIAYHTPVAQPYIRNSTSRAQNILKLRDEKKIFVWEGEDGWIWRLTWIVVAGNFQSVESAPSGRLWFHPYSYDITSPSFLKTLKNFESVISTCL